MVVTSPNKSFFVLDDGDPNVHRKVGIGVTGVLETRVRAHNVARIQKKEFNVR